METVKRHKKVVIIITAVIALILFVFGYLFNLFFGGQIRIGNSAIKHFNYHYYLTPFGERGNSQKEFNYYYQNNMGVFTSRASVVITEYSENDFKAQKEFLENRKQRDKAIGKNWSEGPFSINNWIFIVDAESEPSNMLFIFGFNEQKNKIAYIKFVDMDLDSIDESPSEFFDTYIKYKFR